MAKRCKNCSAEIPADAKFCPQCGAGVQQSGTVNCPNCDTANPAGAKFCKKCGNTLTKDKAAKARPDKTAPFTRNQFWALQGVAILAMIVVGVYYYFGFIKSLEGKTAIHNTPPPQQQAPQSAPAADDHIHPAPSEEEIQAVADQLKQNPEDPALNVSMGNMLFDSGRYAEAIPYYQNALKKEPDNPDVIVDLGVCYFNMEDFQKAKEQFDLAITLNPRHVNALYNLGVVAVQTGEINRLIEYWGRLREIAPNSPQAQRATQILNQIHQNVEGAGSSGG